MVVSSELFRRYEHDEIAQLVLVVEQLEVALGLLANKSIADARAALILLDHHAEILLRRHCETLFRAGDRTGPFAGRAYKKGEIQKIRREFSRKVDVAAGSGLLGENVHPVLCADYAACLKLAHRHRNAAYHRDHHNPDVLHLVCFLQLHAVCHLLTRTTTSLTVSVPDSGPPAALARHGVIGGRVHGLRNGVVLREAAEIVARSVADEVQVPLPAVKAALARDLLARGTTAIEVMCQLLDAGMPAHDLYFAIEHSEFWDKYGSDEQLVELRLRSDRWHRRRPEDPLGRMSEEVEADMALANRLRNERYVELRRQFRPKARQEAVHAAVDQSVKLLHKPALADVVTLYDQLDRDLAVFETYLPKAVRAYDARVEAQIDAALER